MIKGPSLALLTVLKKKLESFLKNALSKDCLGEFFFVWQLIWGWQRTEISIIGIFFLQGFDFFPGEMTVLCPSVITFFKVYLCYIYILDGGLERFIFLKSRIYFHHDILSSHVKKETTRWSISNEHIFCDLNYQGNLFEPQTQSGLEWSCYLVPQKTII